MPVKNGDGLIILEKSIQQKHCLEYIEWYYPKKKLSKNDISPYSCSILTLMHVVHKKDPDSFGDIFFYLPAHILKYFERYMLNTIAPKPLLQIFCESIPASIVIF